MEATISWPNERDVADALAEFIYDFGGPNHRVRCDATYEPLADYFGLSAFQRSVTRDELSNDGISTPKWHNAVQWGLKQLVKRGLLARQAARGVWQLTEAGVAFVGRRRR
jgi:hypothetical protein